MAATRFLIVNADDFGQNPGVNRGIIEAHERGIVTSASLMVNWPAAAEAASLARAHPRLSIGLHVDLCEQAYKEDRWVVVYARVPLEDRAAVEDEVARQLATFRRLLGRAPTHIDSHQHVHREEPVRSILAGIAEKLNVPLRQYSPTVNYCGSFYGQDRKGQPLLEAIAVEGLLETLAGLPPGFTELGCHPGMGQQPASMYGSERAREVTTLCDPRVRAALTAQGIELRSFASLGREGR
jgi:chitin disaccharide deacetylase